MAVRDKCGEPLQCNKLIDTTWRGFELSALSNETTVLAWAPHAYQVALECSMDKATVRARRVTCSAFSWPSLFKQWTLRRLLTNQQRVVYYLSAFILI